MKKKIFTAIGLMSGTSMDGVDLSIIKSDGEGQFTHILDAYFKFNPSLHEKLINLRNKLFTDEDLSKYSKELNELEKNFTLFNAQVVESVLKNFKEKVDLIGFHGQTILHDPIKSFSKQLGDGKLLSQLTKKIVINNFRQEDLNNGGQGAPLTPIFHKLISEIIKKKYDIKFPLNIINIGGITNVTQVYINKVNKELSLRAFDIGPGNCLIDEWVRKNSKKNFDEDGYLAKSGKINELILNQALENFEINSYERSLDIKDFDISFVKGLSLEDGSATLTRFSSSLILRGLEYVNNLNENFPTLQLFCGGGRKNKFLIETINKYFMKKTTKLENIDNYGFDGDFIESQAFAYLCIRSFLNLPNSFPSTTRCLKPSVGGTVIKNF